MLRSGSRNVAAPRYNAGRWAPGADGPDQDNGRGKAEGEPRERAQEEQEEWERVASPTIGAGRCGET